MEWQSPAIETSVVTTVATERQAEMSWQAHDHEVGLTAARGLIASSKRANPGQPSAAAITRPALEALLAQSGCSGVRMYYGQKPDGVRTLVLVAMDEMGNDLDEGLIMDQVIPCPPFCAMDSALDS